MDGQALLEYMHDHANRDSLVYWLEFKNDEELPKQFGSIAGGSALKFGIYRRKESGAWILGRIQSILDRKGQVILYGPPGTGKTYMAKAAAQDLAAKSAFGRRFPLATIYKGKVSGGLW